MLQCPRMPSSTSRSARCYILAAVLVPPNQVGQVRKDTRALLLPGQRELHCKKEKEVRRRLLADTVGSWTSTEAQIYVRRYDYGAESARHACMAALVGDLLARKANRLVIDSREEQDHFDVRTVTQALRSHRAGVNLTYKHIESTSEILLGLPDLVAWCYGAGRGWRERVERLITRVIDVE